MIKQLFLAISLKNRYTDNLIQNLPEDISIEDYIEKDRIKLKFEHKNFFATLNEFFKKLNK